MIFDVDIIDNTYIYIYFNLNIMTFDNFIVDIIRFNVCVYVFKFDKLRFNIDKLSPYFDLPVNIN